MDSSILKPKRTFSLSNLRNTNPFKSEQNFSNEPESACIPLKRALSLHNPFSLNIASDLKDEEDSLNPFSLLNKQADSSCSAVKIPQTRKKSIPMIKVPKQESCFVHPILTRNKRQCCDKENIPPVEFQNGEFQNGDIAKSPSKENGSDSDPEKFENGINSDENLENVEILQAGITAEPLEMTRHVFDEMPIDWTLKTCITIISDLPILFLEPRSQILFDKGDTPKVLESQEFSMDHLVSWSAFTKPNPPSHAKLIGRLLSQRQGSKIESELAELRYFKEREEEWQISFQSLYRLVKSGQLPFLVYTNSLFSLIIRNKGDGVLQALMSRSTKSFRELLKKEEIPFTIVNAQQVDDLELEQNVVDLEGFEGLITTDLQDKTRPNALIFESVHALYDLVLNWIDPRLDCRTKGPPMLMSSGPFLGAQVGMTLVSKAIFVQGDQAMPLKSNNSAPLHLLGLDKEKRQVEEKRGKWRVKITNKGGICPLAVRAMLNRAASENQKGEIKCLFENINVGFVGGSIQEGTLPVKTAYFKSGKWTLSC